MQHEYSGCFAALFAVPAMPIMAPRAITSVGDLMGWLMFIVVLFVVSLVAVGVLNARYPEHEKTFTNIFAYGWTTLIVIPVVILVILVVIFVFVGCAACAGL